MSNALMRGRTLDPKAVEAARYRRETRINSLKGKVESGTATIKERKELIFKWGITPLP